MFQVNVVPPSSGCKNLSIMKILSTTHLVFSLPACYPQTWRPNLKEPYTFPYREGIHRVCGRTNCW